MDASLRWHDGKVEKKGAGVRSARPVPPVASGSGRGLQPGDGVAQRGDHLLLVLGAQRIVRLDAGERVLEPLGAQSGADVAVAADDDAGLLAAVGARLVHLVPGAGAGGGAVI